VTSDASTGPVGPASGPWPGRLAILALGLLAVALTWPLAMPGSGLVPDRDDAYFSMWRLAWIAHQLVQDPRALFDANIFYPARHTLAYSDAMLLVGLAGAPLIWAGVSAATTHNVLLVLAFATSAWAMYAMAHALTRDRAAATIAGLLIMAAPYRFAHIGHLELQWLAWMPLALLAVHRLVAAPRPRTGIALGAALAGQFLCSIYYGVFLTLVAGLAWVAEVVRHWRAQRLPARLVAATAAAAVPLVLVVGPYLLPYATSRGAHGARSEAEVTQFSAVPGDYLRAPILDLVRGHVDQGPAAEERVLYPGTIAIGLALLAFAAPRHRATWVYAAILVVAFDASLGTNGVTFRVLQTIAPPLGNLRAAARFASLALVAQLGLAAMGAARLGTLVGPRARPAVLALVFALAVAEAWTLPVPVRAAPMAPAPADRWLATLPADTVILELPVPRLSALWGHETSHQVRSIFHWRRLANGYSGFAPVSYQNLMADMEIFPSADALGRLRRHSVDYVVVRRCNFTPEAYARLSATLIGVADLGAPIVLGAGEDETAVFPLRPAP
jgi:hypothetical protein